MKMADQQQGATVGTADQQQGATVGTADQQQGATVGTADQQQGATADIAEQLPENFLTVFESFTDMIAQKFASDNSCPPEVLSLQQGFSKCMSQAVTVGKDKLARERLSSEDKKMIQGELLEVSGRVRLAEC